MKRPIFLPQAFQLCLFHVLILIVVSQPVGSPASVSTTFDPTLTSTDKRFTIPSISFETVPNGENPAAKTGTKSSNEPSDPGNFDEKHDDSGESPPNSSNTEKKPENSGESSQNSVESPPNPANSDNKPENSGESPPNPANSDNKPENSGESSPKSDNSSSNSDNSGSTSDANVSTGSTDEKGTNVGVIAGAVVGGVAALLNIAVAVRFAIRRTIVEDVPEIDMQDNHNSAPSYVDAAVAQRLSREQRSLGR